MSAEPVPYPAAEATCTEEACNRPAWLSCPEGFCLFHSPYNGRLDAAARIVWKTARRMAQAGDCDFRRWHFPPDPDLDPDERQGGFVDATFSGDAMFQGAIFSGDAWFQLATFSGDALFEGATFSGNACFFSATFSGKALFNGARFSGDAMFQGAIFSGEAWFQLATFSGDARFEHATFSWAARFVYATFSRHADFRRVTFGADALFFHATFSGGASFAFATFEQEVSFREARCPEPNINFDRPGRWPWMRPLPFVWPREGETAYRLAKRAAQERADYAEAGRYHYAEQCAIEDREKHASGYRPWRSAFLFWIGRLLFGRIVFGYGEKPSHPLLLGLAVILAWALVFGCIDGVVPDPKSAQTSLAWWQYGYFSVVTFTTLGYGDYQPRQGWPQVLAGFEAALGAALLATFVVCLTRKYMR